MTSRRRPILFASLLSLLALVVATASVAEAQRRGGGGRRQRQSDASAPAADTPSGGEAAGGEAAPPPSPPKDSAIAAIEPEILAYAIGPARSALGRVADPASAPALVAEGRVLTLEAKYDEAISRFDRAASEAPDDPAPLVYKGEAQLYARQEGAARQSFAEAKRRAEQALARSANDAEALYHLGMAQQRLGEHDAAISTLERARELAPGDERIPYQMGATRFLQQRWQQAFDLTSQALDRNPRLAYGYWIRGNAAGQIDRKDLLVNDLRRFVELAPNAPEAERARRILASVKG